MVITLARSFWKGFDKKPTKIKSKFFERIDIFRENINAPILKNHKLQGKWAGKYSINVTGDIRAIYQKDKNGYVFVAIGSHSDLYE